MRVSLTVDGTALEAEEGWTILQAAQAAEIYIPTLCAHPDLPPQCKTEPVEAVHHADRRIEHVPAEGDPGEASGAPRKRGCGLCVVEVAGLGNKPACATPVEAGMVVTTAGAEIEELRRERLSAVLAHHPHACLTCAQREGCTREPCSMNVPKPERCCPKLGSCELEHVAAYIGIAPSTPRYVADELAAITDEPLFDRDLALCVACGRCVRACDGRDVGALGWVRDSSGRRWVGPLAPTPVEAGCRLCGSCVEVCPTGALTDRGIKPGQREEALVPCRSACPAGTDVPRYVRLAADGRFEEAAAVVAERAPLVEVLGHVCFHPCEDACRRHDVNEEPISICAVKRELGAASAASWTSMLDDVREAARARGEGRKVAVVGGGPAGITAAHVLDLLGHHVTLFEANAKLGGMLSYGIPAFRLPREVVDRETTAVLEGVEVRTSAPLDKEAVQRLRTEHDAVLVATGAPASVTLDVPGEDMPQIRGGLAFLADVATGKLDLGAMSGETVVVVGGGNVAVDCARSALRLGAAAVHMVSLEQPDEMPAHPFELKMAAEEGVRFHHGWGIRAFSGDGQLSDVEIKACARVFDEQGRFDPLYDEDTTKTVAACAAVVAAGQRQDRSLLPDSLAGVFLAGDLATGPASVVEAIASGREAALAADRHLGGAGELSLRLGPSFAPAGLGRVEGFTSLPRLEPEPPPEEHRSSLDTAAPGLGAERAREEADRCLRCDLRLLYHRPPTPPARQERLALSEESLALVPEGDGVVCFYDQAGEILEIVGGSDMRAEVEERLDAGPEVLFDFEPHPMFTQRQNELLSRYMESHGKMPPGVREEDDLDDLF